MTTIDSEEEGEAHLFACKCGGNATAVSCGVRAAPIDSKVVKIKLSKKKKKNVIQVGKTRILAALPVTGEVRRP